MRHAMEEKMEDKNAASAPEQLAVSGGASPTPPAEPAQPQAPSAQPTQPAQPAMPQQPAADPNWAAYRQYAQAQQQYAYGQQQYPPAGAMPAYGQQPQPAQSGGKAVASLVLGILAILFAFAPIVGLILGIVAVALASKHRKVAGPDGKATGGKVCGIIGIVLSALVFAITLAFGMLFMSAYNNSVDSSLSSVPIDPDVLIEALDETDVIDSPADEEEIRRQATELLDGFVNLDAETMADLTQRVEWEMEAYAGWNYADLGMDPADFIRWRFDGFSYEITHATVRNDGEATVTAKVVMRDRIEFYTRLCNAIVSFEESEEFAAMTQEEIFARKGELLRQAMEETTEMTDERYYENYGTYYEVYMDFNKTDQGWALDQDDWDGTLNELVHLGVGALVANPS